MDTSLSALEIKKVFDASRHTNLNIVAFAIMERQILKHIPRYGVIVCTLCKDPHCVSINSLGKHYRIFHADSVSKQQRGLLVKYAQTLKDELQDPQEVKLITPAFDEGPIDGLHKVHGYECTECKKLLPQLYSMEQHCRLHGWGKKKIPDMWTRKWMQVY